MKKSLLIVSVLILGLGIQACTKKAPEPAGEEPAKPAAEKPAEPAAKPAEPAAAPSGDSDSIGVAECDEYISKVQKCIEGKVPAAGQTAFKQGMEQSISAWKKAAAAGPAAKSALAQGCSQALETMKTSLSQFNCEW